MPYLFIFNSVPYSKKGNNLLCNLFTFSYLQEAVYQNTHEVITSKNSFSKRTEEITSYGHHHFLQM